MSKIRNLPQAIKQELFSQGYQEQNNVIWLAGQPEFNDQAHDGQLTFSVNDTQHSGYVHINSKGDWQYYELNASDKPSKKPRFTQKFSSNFYDTKLADWAKRREMELLGPNSRSTIVEEQTQSQKAAQALKSRMGHEVPQGVFTDATQLAPIHPAKDFLENIVEKPNVPLDRFYKFKSAGVYYQFGREYAQTHPVKDQKIQIMVPASGVNLPSAMTAAMAIVEGGAKQIKMVGTEATMDFRNRDRHLSRVLETMKAWTEFDPNLELLSSDWQPTKAKYSGERYSLKLNYLGRPIELVFTFGDAPAHPSPDLQDLGYTRQGNPAPIANIPQQFFFDPQDFKNTNIFLVHDVYSGKGQHDLLFLKQLTPIIDDISPKQTMLITDGIGFSKEFEKHVPENLKRYQDYYLPFGHFIPGSYGHSFYIQVQGRTWGESGLVQAKGARWFDMDHPIIAETIKMSQEAPEEKYWESMIDFFQWVASEEKIVGDPGLHGPSSTLEAKSKLFSKYKKSKDGSYQEAAGKWLFNILPRLDHYNRAKLLLLF